MVLLARLAARRTSPRPPPAPLTPPIDLHSSARRHALSKFAMPAMSPTMTEGGIAAWKKNEGDPFSAGDVLLEIVRCPPPLPHAPLLTPSTGDRQGLH